MIAIVTNSAMTTSPRTTATSRAQAELRGFSAQPAVSTVSRFSAPTRTRAGAFSSPWAAVPHLRCRHGAGDIVGSMWSATDCRRANEALRTGMNRSTDDQSCRAVTMCSHSLAAVAVATDSDRRRGRPKHWPISKGIDRRCNIWRDPCAGAARSLSTTTSITPPKWPRLSMPVRQGWPSAAWCWLFNRSLFRTRGSAGRFLRGLALALRCAVGDLKSSCRLSAHRGAGRSRDLPARCDPAAWWSRYSSTRR